MLESDNDRVADILRPHLNENDLTVVEAGRELTNTSSKGFNILGFAKLNKLWWTEFIYETGEILKKVD